jgi:hypothetical protein
MNNLLDNIDLIFLYEAHKKNLHMSLDGSFVDCHSEECAEDLRRRIKDTSHTRDSSNTRSDERSYYNGVLRVLRRRLREVEKHLSQNSSLNESKKRTSRRRQVDSSRLMKMAGIL